MFFNILNNTFHVLTLTFLFVVIMVLTENKSTLVKEGGFKMNFLRICVVIIFLTFGVAFIGCGGGGTKVRARQVTTGQELIDLDKAHKDGLITDKEYKKNKEKILKEAN